MKKLTAFIISTLLLAVVLTGCTAPAESGTPPTGETKIYTDTTGRKVEIPTNPQRIVTVNMTAEVIALGIKPVGASENWLNPLDDEQRLGIESVGSATALNLEKILELEPDLIITFEKITDKELLDSLSKIAPTVVGPFFGDSIENLRTIGNMIGRETEAEAWISAYEAKADSTREALSTSVPQGKTTLVLRLSSEKSMALFPISTWPTVYEVLGLTLTAAPELAEITSGYNLSLEKLTEYDPDYIFITGAGDFDTLAYQNELLESSVWQQLSAAKNNQVYFLGSRITTGDVLALDWALDEIVRAVEAAE